jgi:hypothetical protein
MKTADGVVRCLPTGMYGSSYYADAACSIPVGWTFAAQCVTSVPKYIAVTSVASDPCDTGSVETRVVGPLYSGQLWLKGSGNCVALTSQPAGYVFYSVGDVVPASEFAPVSYSTE